MAKSTSKSKAASDTQIISYRHDEQTRKNIPEVGLVDSAADPPSPPRTWAYDPHIDPALQFDSARAAVEKIIDDALASDDVQAMRMRLQRLSACKSRI